ncbi:unnamed protein product [Echinostoma caproni]|uniref:Helicase C-terminal domain-containing protein n=1 Tax=Echinostoma caproni TaxID=27848 RepID=A0A183APU9_9TREM|nr:unnamed protein product [Echinostoma caproni]
MNAWDVDLEDLESSFVLKSRPNSQDTLALPGKRVYESEPVRSDVKRTKKEGPKFETYVLNSGEGCLHEVVYPAGQSLKPLVPITEPARQYPFTLDSFQREAVTCIENGQSVLVAAHTSAGKTVVADVGLVFLSATIPNARQFAEWIVFLHKQPCHVVYTEYRPVPLQHYLFPCGGDGIHLVVNQKREFLEPNFQTAMSALYKAAGNAASDTQMRGRRGGSIRSKPYCAKLVKLVMDQNLEPLIVFSFSKVDCEFYATQMNKMDFNTDKEKAAVDLIFKNAIDSLSAEDKRLPQVQILLPVLRRGVGIHHGGLLPILKEIVEILFAEGLIKVLYATETFAMGLNMPARTVLFTATRKFDGQSFRLVSSGEYIQMSGRAGRRGKDDRGTVILMLDDQISATEVRQLLSGQPDRLDSAFYLTNTMVLNLLRVEDINPELMLEKSFLQFQTKSSAPPLNKRIKALEAEIKAIQFPVDVDLDKLSSLVQLKDAKLSAERERWSIVLKAKSVIPFLQTGRVLRVHTVDDIDFGWAVLLHVEQPQTAPIRGQKSESSGTLLLHCLLETLPLGAALDHDNEGMPGQRNTKPASVPLSMVEPAQSEFFAPDLDDKTLGSEKRTTVQVVSVPLSCVAELSSVCLKVRSVLTDSSGGFQAGKSADLMRRVSHLSESIRRHLWEGINRARDQLDGVLPLLDPLKDMRIADPKLKQLMEMTHMLDARIALNPISKRTDVDSLMDLFAHKATKLHELKVLQKHLESQDSLVQLDELHARKRLLRRLGFCQEDDVIAFKGRVACEISSGDELMLTELMLDGLFSNLTAAQLAGVLSCFVVERNAGKADKLILQPDMDNALKQIQTKARFLARAAAECRVGASRTQKEESDIKRTAIPEAGALLNNRVGILDDEQAYVDRFSGELMEVVRAWAEGVSFARLCELTHVFEGSVIRCMRRLEELLRQMHDAAKVAGNSELENKFVQAMVMIKRDIVFAASLYL